jgi:ubiquinone/menaquinone biosynthesis C-methylase UbiE
MSGINDTNEMKKQYGTDQNLNSRILLHRLFSTNKQGWGNWVFENYRLKPGLSILELGCGNAGIWKS